MCCMEFFFPVWLALTEEEQAHGVSSSVAPSLGLWSFAGRPKVRGSITKFRLALLLRNGGVMGTLFFLGGGDALLLDNGKVL